MDARPPISSLVGTPAKNRQNGRLPAGPVHTVSMLPLLHTLYDGAAANESRVIQVIGSRPREGVSTIVRGIAGAAAENAGLRVLICDVSPTRNALTELGMTTRPISLCNAAAKGLNLSEAIVWLHGTTTAVCALADESWDNRIAVSLDTCRNILSLLKSSFDLVLLDTPPIATHALGRTIARVSDGVVIVVESERTRVPSVIATRRAIEAAGGRVVGVVLNKRRQHIPDSVYRRL